MTSKQLRYQANKINMLSLLCAICVSPAFATDISSVTTGKNAAGGYEIQLGGNDFSGVRSYSLSNPARIVVDIPNAKSRLVERLTEISHPIISSVAVIEGDDRVRATISMSKSLPYEIVEKPNRITVLVKNSSGSKNKRRKAGDSAIRKSSVDFRKGSEGQGKVLISLPQDGSAIDVQRKGNKIIATLQNGHFSQTRRLNVIDFGTPVNNVDIYKNSVSISTLNDDYEMVSYQSDNVFAIEFTKKSDTKENNQAQLPPGDSNKEYSGEPLSLNFQDIEVRAVLQLIGDFTNTNIVVSDAVSGSITLRLNNVPWDQALDIILQTKGLSQQKNGDVIFVAPSADIAASKKAAYDVVNVEKELAPLQQQLIQVQYARAENLEKIIEDNRTGATKESASSGLLSVRGSISVDERTNTLIINDVSSSIAKVRQLVSKLDVAVDQVLIDARIVAASSNFAHELGVRWGGAAVGSSGSYALGASGNAAAASGITSGVQGNAGKATTPSLANRLGVNLSSASATSSALGFSLLGNDFMLDLELSAMQDEGRGEIISSPRVIAQDGGEAEIKQGTQIAYTAVDKDGNAKTQFKDIPLMLKVSPKIAPNNQVDMELEITKDKPGLIYNGQQGIDTNQVKTQVLVDNGETVVLGGVYEQTKIKSTSKVPLLGDLPVVGRAFRKDTNNISKSELLIFVTPKIIDKRYTSRDKFNSIRQ